MKQFEKGTKNKENNICQEVKITFKSPWKNIISKGKQKKISFDRIINSRTIRENKNFYAFSNIDQPII